MEAVAQQPDGEAAVLDGPDRPAVVAVRVVRGVPVGERADAPAREQVGGEEARHRARHQGVVQDARGHAVPAVRSHGADGPALRVEGHGREALVLHPEGVGEALLQLLGLVVQPLGQVLLAQPPQHLGKVQLGHVHEGLLLARRDGRLHG